MLPAWESVPVLLPGWGVSTACLGMSTCIACTPPGLQVSAACLGMSACTAYTPPELRVSTACLGNSAFYEKN